MLLENTTPVKSAPEKSTLVKILSLKTLLDKLLLLKFASTKLLLLNSVWLIWLERKLAFKKFEPSNTLLEIIELLKDENLKLTNFLAKKNESTLVEQNFRQD